MGGDAFPSEAVKARSKKTPRESGGLLWRTWMNRSVARSDSGKIPTRVIVFQIVFLVFLTGVFAYVKIYSPRMGKAKAAAELAERESRVNGRLLPDFLEIKPE